MKKPDATGLAPRQPIPALKTRLARLWRALCAPINRLGIRSRIFVYFLVFTAALLTLLWVFQIGLLSDFYSLQKTKMLTSAIDLLADNIDNVDLQLLSDRIAETNDVCVLIIDAHTNKLISSDVLRDCVIHRMGAFDLSRYVDLLNADPTTLYRIFSLGGFGKTDYDENHFSGRVPPADDGHAKSMVAMRAVQTEAGEARYVFVNALITPVDATVQTLQSQFALIALLMVLLSFGISLVLSRRIAQPIVGASEAARGLSEGRYEPADTRVSYREILQLNQTLRQAAKDLQRVEEMQRELIANISHDLRTPLTLIEGYAEAMRDLPGENTPENMQVIIDEAKRLTSLVNAVLEYSAGKNGKNPIETHVYNFTDSVHCILDRYSKLTEQNGYQIQFEYTQRVWVLADEMKIGQVLYNLINNALTYTGADQRVTVAQTVQGGMVRVEVKDTGEGIDAKELPYIWSRYYRGQKPHKRATVGTGLGLSIVKGILDSHHMQYGVDSQLGVGTTFWFELPVEKTEPLP
ncbi:MAG TPA: HAMP domain-containing sensor histidine kinase [Candidatus Limiplasma sp.]|nr:HAMP domain-containing sensor histidine kinase [Candidatus Limiplasma sp.]HPS81052.1 HAMP domain-containing sensor histidine kinase [Candidatus Limiplasma sp.]